MGDLNQLLYAKAVFPGFRGRLLEIGSKDYGNTQPFRQTFADCEYVGVDLEAGKNVDAVVDLERGVGPLAGRTFDLIIMCSVLEHSPRPWIIAQNLQTLLADDGALLSCHPWVWRYHKYPDDYFRFSPKGIQSLFPELGFWLPVHYASNVQGEFVSFSEDEHIDDKLAIFSRSGRKYLPYLQTMMTGTRSASIHQRLLASYQSACSSGNFETSDAQAVRQKDSRLWRLQRRVGRASSRG
jgi:hypothetical protein